MVGWDEVLDAMDRDLTAVEEALATDAELPDLPPFSPPSDVMPPLSAHQLARAQGIMRRQAGLQVRVSAEIVSTSLDMGEVRRRRRAAVAYSRS